ncbi:P-loop containing nucleoside triphosphate hydrolase protein [Radiomyces spectabilis]|uniref:P-loop containing nucleoside triphosphate hydrolase protein n=1 Tax=Radiomyces spectabilis TaxID=64574 RepID=UPI002220BBE2|nr:P-loop containing nucleoside triphosphate hydrolase protein [Radiomyces spectabilis]KAI8388912.1 P-loop containing nucleoside triphosphate hydrolase protein [Radiomyces spectabilis]
MAFSTTSNEQDRQQRLGQLLAIVQKRSAAQKGSSGAEEPPNKEAKRSHAVKSHVHRHQQPTSALPDYHFQSDKMLPMLNLELRPEIEVRPYQNEAVDAVIKKSDKSGESVARSGIIVLPCGAGKTLTSIVIACAIQKPILVVCSTIIAAEQFSKEFLKFTTLMASKTGMFAGAKKWPYNGPAGVLFTTYTMLVENKNRTADSKRMSQFIDKTEWGMIILDEVHCVPAMNFSKAITKIKAQVRIGLTATMLREDEKIGDLETLVGPIVYHAKWKELADRGYIAKVICTQVEVDMPSIVRKEYDSVQGQGGSVLGHTHHLKSLLAILNPIKMQICQRLIHYHEAKGDKVLVYCDHIDALKQYAEKIGRPYIYGGTPTDEARQLLQRFQIDVPTETAGSWSEMAARRVQRAKQISTLFLSRIGDTSLDLPAATVLIQVSSHFGSRRQEAQRLGRILRAKKRSEKGFYSRFYTLVTDHTHEVSFSERRRQFLEEDCGYGYQIWKVGDEDPDTGGWKVTDFKDSTAPADDEVQTEPVTCAIQGAGERPFVTTSQQEQLIRSLRELKNIQVEDDDLDGMANTASNGPPAAVGAKRKRNTTTT